MWFIPDMEIETLRTLVDLELSGSFSATAVRCSVTQSAVSQRIRSLEAELKVRLVERAPGRSGVVLTDDGRHAASIAREMVSLAERLREELPLLSRPEGVRSLRIGTVYSMGLHSFTGVFAQFLSRYPDVALHVEYLRTDRIYEALRLGEIDCGVVACPKTRPGVVVCPLEPERMVVVAAPCHPLAGVQCGPQLLAEHRFISFDRRIPTRRLVDQWFQKMGIAVVADGEFDNVETIKQKVELGAGLAVLPEPTVRRELADRSLVRIRMEAPDLLRPTGLLLPKGRLPGRALQDFVALVAPADAC